MKFVEVNAHKIPRMVAAYGRTASRAVTLGVASVGCTHHRPVVIASDSVTHSSCHFCASVKVLLRHVVRQLYFANATPSLLIFIFISPYRRQRKRRNIIK